MNQNEWVKSVDELVKSNISNIHTATPGTVISYNASTNKATVKPSVKFKATDGRTLDFPIIVGCPVVFPCGLGGSASFTFPIAAGDECMIIFAESSIDDVVRGGESSDLRKHSITDAMVIPGMFNHNVNKFPNDVALSFGDANIRITKSGDIKAKINGTFEVSGGDLIVDGISVKNHVHGGDSGGTTTKPR